MDNCIFCKIINGEIPSYKVWEDENYFAFLDIHPFYKGHTLIIPKKHTDYIFDLDDENLAEYTQAAKKVAAILKKAFQPKTGKVGVVVIGNDVLHAHIHLIPMDNGGADLHITPATSTSKEELEDSLKKIKATL